MKKKVDISFVVSDEAQLQHMNRLLARIDENAEIKIREIVYNCKNGGDYSSEDVKDDIRLWMSETSPFKFMESAQKEQAVEIVYPILLHSLTWQCPATLLQEWDEDDIIDLLSKLESKLGKITFTKEHVIKMLGERGYDQDDLECDRNLFWEVVREFFNYDENNNVFSLVGED